MTEARTFVPDLELTARHQAAEGGHVLAVQAKRFCSTWGKGFLWWVHTLAPVGFLLMRSTPLRWPTMRSPTRS